MGQINQACKFSLGIMLPTQALVPGGTGKAAIGKNLQVCAWNRSLYQTPSITAILKAPSCAQGKLTHIILGTNSRWERDKLMVREEASVARFRRLLIFARQKMRAQC